MGEPRLSSPGRNLPAFQTDSEKNPNGFHTPRVPPGTRVRDGKGYGKDSQAVLEAAERSTARFNEATRWAAEHLPDESPMWTASAYLHLRYVNRRDPSVAEVAEHLRATGRARKATA